MIVNLQDYKPTPCLCTEPPQTNEFYFCERCKGTVLRADGMLPDEVHLAVKRFMYLTNKK